MTTEFSLRPGRETDLDAINRVIKGAIESWQLPARVKRLSLPSYCYNSHDLQHLSLLVASKNDGELVGVAAWETADKRDTPDNQPGLLLHGLYVADTCQGQGIGSALLTAALKAAEAAGYNGLLVKAQTDAVGFFEKQGMTHLANTDEKRDYPYRFWQPTTAARHIKESATDSALDKAQL